MTQKPRDAGGKPGHPFGELVKTFAGGLSKSRIFGHPSRSRIEDEGICERIPNGTPGYANKHLRWSWHGKETFDPDTGHTCHTARSERTQENQASSSKPRTALSVWKRIKPKQLTLGRRSYHRAYTHDRPFASLKLEEQTEGTEQHTEKQRNYKRELEQGMKYIRKRSKSESFSSQENLSEKGPKTPLEKLNRLMNQKLDGDFNEEGSKHDIRYTWTFKFKDQLFKGSGRRKQAAKQQAAENFLHYLETHSAGEAWDRKFEPLAREKRKTDDCKTEELNGDSTSQELSKSHVWQQVYQLWIQFDVTLKSNKSLFSDQMNKVCRLTSALLNGSGGVIVLKNKDHPPNQKETEMWKAKLYDRLNNFIEKDIVDGNIAIRSGDQQSLVINVTQSHRLVTYVSNMYTRNGHNTVMVAKSEACAQIIDQSLGVEAKLPISNLSGYKYGDHIDLTEGKNFEVKYFQTTTYDDFEQRLSRDLSTVERCLYAFANTIGGGHLILGIEEERNALYSVKGQLIPEKEEETITALIANMLSKDGTNSEGTLRCTIDCSVAFYGVSPTEVSKADGRRALVLVHVCQYGGGTFTKPPECYTSKSTTGEVVPVTVTEWKGKMLEYAKLL